MIISELAFESEWVLKAITNDIRRKILFLIDDYSFLTYTDLLRELDLSTGKLNFHLRQLTGLIDKKGEKTYILTSAGNRALELLKQLQSLDEETHEIIELKSAFDNLSMKIFYPAIETKRKWTTIIISLCILSMISWIIISIILDYKNIIFLRNLEKASRLAIEISLGILILGFLSSFIIILSRIYFKSLEYELLDTEIIIRRGIITKSKTVIPFRTITNLLIRRGPLDRFFGISTLLIQTAGEGGTKSPEGKMVGIYYPHALLEEILNLVRLLDPPRFLKESIRIAHSPPSIRSLYNEILNELKIIKEKVSENN